MRIAASPGFGSNPEELAFNQMYEFARKEGLLEDGKLRVTYGFNRGHNPRFPSNFGRSHVQ